MKLKLANPFRLVAVWRVAAKSARVVRELREQLDRKGLLSREAADALDELTSEAERLGMYPKERP